MKENPLHTETDELLKNEIHRDIALLGTSIDEYRSRPEFIAFEDFFTKLPYYSWGLEDIVNKERNTEYSLLLTAEDWNKRHRQVREGTEGTNVGIASYPEGQLKYTQGTVYDVLQTEGDPIPTIPILEISSDTEEGRKITASLMSYLDRNDIRVTRERKPKLNGSYSPDTRTITLDPRLSGDRLTKTLTHETAHYLNNHRDSFYTNEVHTEGATFISFRHFGLDILIDSTQYLAKYVKNKKEVEMQKDVIIRTGLELINIITGKPFNKIKRL